MTQPMIWKVSLGDLAAVLNPFGTEQLEPEPYLDPFACSLGAQKRFQFFAC